MEAPGAGQQEPGAIDLSLDDIIKRKQKERAQLRNRSPAFANRRPRVQSWVSPTLPGSSRFPRGFGKPHWSRKPFWSRMSGPGPRAARQMQGRSPLNRAAFAPQEKPGKPPPGRNGNGAPADPPTEEPASAKDFTTAGMSLPFRSNRPLRPNQRPVFLQSQSKFNFNERQIKSKMEGTLSRMRRWRMQPNSGAVLTISVSNFQAGHFKGPGPKRPFLRRRNSQAPQPSCQPRGVPLRFNFRAMANQTSVTLNERFSGLRHKRHFTAYRSRSRMVTLP